METHKRGEEPQEQKRGTVFIIRQILNLLFMILALVGAVLYWTDDDSMTGIIVIITAVFFKMAECTMRTFKVKSEK